MSDPTKELIFQNDVIAEMVASGWKRGNPEKFSSGYKGQNSGYNEPDSGHNQIVEQPNAPARRIAATAPPTVSKMAIVKPASY